MPRISNSIKSGDFNEFDDGVKDASGAVCALTESAAQVCLNLIPVRFEQQVQKHTQDENSHGSFPIYLLFKGTQSAGAHVH